MQLKFSYYATYVKAQNLDVLAVLTYRPSKTDDAPRLFQELKKNT